MQVGSEQIGSWQTLVNFRVADEEAEAAEDEEAAAEEEEEAAEEAKPASTRRLRFCSALVAADPTISSCSSLSEMYSGWMQELWMPYECRISFISSDTCAIWIGLDWIGNDEQTKKTRRVLNSIPIQFTEQQEQRQEETRRRGGGRREKVRNNERKNKKTKHREKKQNSSSNKQETSKC